MPINWIKNKWNRGRRWATDSTVDIQRWSEHIQLNFLSHTLRASVFWSKLSKLNRNAKDQKMGWKSHRNEHTKLHRIIECGTHASNEHIPPKSPCVLCCDCLECARKHEDNNNAGEQQTTIFIRFHDGSRLECRNRTRTQPIRAPRSWIIPSFAFFIHLMCWWAACDHCDQRCQRTTPFDCC